MKKENITPAELDKLRETFKTKPMTAAEIESLLEIEPTCVYECDLQGAIITLLAKFERLKAELNGRSPDLNKPRSRISASVDDMYEEQDSKGDKT